MSNEDILEVLKMSTKEELIDIIFKAEIPPEKIGLASILVFQNKEIEVIRNQKNCNLITFFGKLEYKRYEKDYIRLEKIFKVLLGF